MNFEEYLKFLLYIRSKHNISKLRYSYIPRRDFKKRLDFLIKTPFKLLNSDDLFSVGYLLGKYFGKEGIRIVYNENYKWEKWREK